MYKYPREEKMHKYDFQTVASQVKKQKKKKNVNMSVMILM